MVAARCFAAVLFGAASLCVGADAPPASAPAAVPAIDAATYLTMADLRKYFDEKQFLLVSQQIVKIQGNKRVLETFDPVELNALKGEAMFRTGRFGQAAIDAMTLAARQSKDAGKAAEYKATALLFKRTTAGFKYTPKTAAPSPLTGNSAPPAAIDVSDMSQRKAALQALFTDEFAAQEPAIKRAQIDTSLVPVANVARTLDDLRTLEVAATGQNAKTLTLRQNIGKHAADLMTGAIGKMATQVTDIEATANRLETYFEPMFDAQGRPVAQQQRQRKHGLSKNDSDRLTNIAREADRISTAITELAELLQVDAKTFDKPAPAAAKLQRDAKAVLAADYSAPLAPRR